MTLELKATCLSKELRDAIDEVFEKKKIDGKMTELESMFWFIVEEMPECPKEE